MSLLLTLIYYDVFDAILTQYCIVFQKWNIANIPQYDEQDILDQNFLVQNRCSGSKHVFYDIFCWTQELHPFPRWRRPLANSNVTLQEIKGVYF